MKRIFFLAAFSVLIVTSAFAASPDASGKWKWNFERNGESIEIVMNLKQEGSKLSGKILAPEGREIEIQKGQISEDGKLSFFINFERANGPLKIEFSGKQAGDKITGKTEYTSDSGDKREREWNAKRENPKS